MRLPLTTKLSARPNTLYEVRPRKDKHGVELEKRHLLDSARNRFLVGLSCPIENQISRVRPALVADGPYRSVAPRDPKENSGITHWRHRNQTPLRPVPARRNGLVP